MKAIFDLFIDQVGIWLLDLFGSSALAS